LRASHQEGLLEEAWKWVAESAAAGDLQAPAAGVASLIAVDLGFFAEAKQMALADIEAGAAGREALVARATVALAEGDTATARDCLRPALAVHADDGRTWSTLGMASLQARDLVAARSQFARASQLMPGHVGTWHGLGWSCLLLQDRPGALSAFQQALRLDETFAESHGAVGLVLALGGRMEEAEHHLARADRLDRRNLTSRYARALVRGQVQDLQALRQLAEKLLDRPGLFGRRLIDNVDAMKSKSGAR
jgi:Flp pilus assembly protein TadD